jgi:hypothetical protein
MNASEGDAVGGRLPGQPGGEPIPDEDGVYKFTIGSGITPPRETEPSVFDYHRFAGDPVTRGALVGEVVIGIDGTVREAKVIRGIGPELDEAFIDWLERKRFEPASLNGEPVPVRFIIAQRVGG